MSEGNEKEESRFDSVVSDLMYNANRFCRMGIYPVEMIGFAEIKLACVDPMDFNTIQDFEALTDLQVKKKVQSTRGECDVWWAEKKEEFGISDEPEVDMGAVMNGVAAELGIEPLKQYSAGELADMFPPVEEIERPSPSLSRKEPDPDDLNDEAGESASPIINLTNRIIEDAFVQGAALIYLFPHADAFLVYLDVRGEARPVIELPLVTMQPVIRRLKIMADLDPFKQGTVHGLIDFKKWTNVNIDCFLNLTVVSEGETGSARLVLLEGNVI